MEQAILGLVGLMIILALNQERVRRADVAALRQDGTDLRKDMTDGLAAVRKDMTDGFAAGVTGQEAGCLRGGD